MNSIDYQSFTSFLSEHSLSVNDGEVCIELDSQKVDNTQVESILKSVGYRFDEVRTIRKGKVFLSLSAQSWDEQCVIYESWEKLFTTVERTSKLPVYAFVLESNQSIEDDSDFRRVLELFCATRKLLASLADQCEPPQGDAKGSRKLFYIIETDSGVAKYDFKPILSWSDLKAVSTDVNQVSLVNKLIKLTQLGDSQDTERRSVMRSAFHEIISTCHDESEIFQKIIGSIVHFHKRYEEHHELFVKRFSINKVLHEINEQDLTYTSKINEILSSAQNKALTIPGALIVVGAVMRIDQLADGIAIALGMLITTIIVHRSLKVHEVTFKHIGKQVDAEFKRYDVLNENVEIRMRAKQTNNDISDLLTKASDNSKFMKGAIWFICIVALLFIIFTYCNLSSADSDDIKGKRVVGEEVLKSNNVKPQHPATTVLDPQPKEDNDHENIVVEAKVSGGGEPAETVVVIHDKDVEPQSDSIREDTTEPKKGKVYTLPSKPE